MSVKAQVVAATIGCLQLILLGKTTGIGLREARTPAEMSMRVPKSIGKILSRWSHLGAVRVVKWGGKRVDLLLGCNEHGTSVDTILSFRRDVSGQLHKCGAETTEEQLNQLYDRDFRDAEGRPNSSTGDLMTNRV